MTPLVTAILMPAKLSAKVLAAGAALAFVAATPAAAQMQQDDPDMENIARTPLEVLNIGNEAIPEVLVTAALDPYASGGLTTCNDIVGQVALLDMALGADFDIAVDQERRLSGGRVAKSIVGSFIPFRSIVQEVSGANARRNEVNKAITSGMVRRAFLKGMGLERGCAYPARPRPDDGPVSAGE